MKAQRQSSHNTMAGTRIGVTIAPILPPELKMPVASARSFLGNHSATALVPAGNAPPSPTPSTTRETMKPVTAPARP